LAYNGLKRPQTWFIQLFGAALPSMPSSFGKKTVKIKGFPFGFSTVKHFLLALVLSHLSSIQEVNRANLRL
jgi:hypothetical protein